MKYGKKLAVLKCCPHCAEPVIFMVEKVKPPISIVEEFKSPCDCPDEILCGKIYCDSCGAGMVAYSSFTSKLVENMEINWNKRVVEFPMDRLAVSAN